MQFARQCLRDSRPRANARCAVRGILVVARAARRGWMASLQNAAAAVAPGALIAFLDNRYVEGSSTPVSRRDAEGNSYQTAQARRRQHARGAEELSFRGRTDPRARDDGLGRARGAATSTTGCSATGRTHEARLRDPRPGAGPALPLVLDSPHSGNRFPADFDAVVSEAELRDGEDCFVDELCARRPPNWAPRCSRRSFRAPTSIRTGTPATSTSS